MSISSLTPEVASKFARLALSHVTREYPNKLDHVLNDEGDLLGPRELHPVFYGSFDWHSCVHGYWLLATLLRLFPESEEAAQTTELFDAQVTDTKVKAEVAYLAQPNRGTFERPYGWAWLLMLATELSRHRTAHGAKWYKALQPLTDAIVDRFEKFLPKATYPSRVGTHFNSAFAIALALQHAATSGNPAFAKLLKDKARAWFGADADCQAWEPGGDDFLSSALIEAECMRGALPAAEFQKWISRFLPRIAEREPQTLFTPATVSDRSDAKIAHLDGLNLTRAWCWRSLASTWADSDERTQIALAAASDHLRASLPHVAGDYMGEHWLATFALLALL